MRPTASPCAPDSVSPQPPPPSCGCVVMPLELPKGQAPRPGPYAIDDIDCPLFEPISPQAREMLLDMRREREEWDAEVERRFRVGEKRAQDGVGFPPMRSQSRHRRRRDAEAGWQPGDEFPAGETGCDGWTIEDYAARLMDPDVSDGCASSSWTGWQLRTTSVAVVRIADRDVVNGRKPYRLFFFDGILATNDSELIVNHLPLPRAVRTAVVQSDGTFVVDRYGYGQWLDLQGRSFLGFTPTQDDQAQWWRTSESDFSVSDLCFSSHFISYVESADGQSFDFWAPRVVPASNRTDACDYMGSSVEYEFNDSAGNPARAGWRSTILPCYGREVVYQSDSVIFVTFGPNESAPSPYQHGIYLMFCVMCDGRGGAGTKGATQSYRDSGCDICAPSAGTGCAPVPATRYVFFVCDTPDFQENVIGPLDALPASPQSQFGVWIGVPQAFTSPDGRFLFLHIRPDAGNLAGMYVARMGDVASSLVAILNSAPIAHGVSTGGLPLPSPSTLAMGRSLFAPNFVNFGSVTISGRPQGHEASNPGDFRDEFFYFCNDGRLHLMYTTFVRTSTAEGPLVSVAHASALRVMDGSAVGDAIDVNLGSTSSATTTTTFELIGSLLAYCFGDCDPLNIVRYLGPYSFENFRQAYFQEVKVDLPMGGAVRLEVNDPAVYPVATDGYGNQKFVMLFHSAALGGLIRSTTWQGCAHSCEGS